MTELLIDNQSVTLPNEFQLEILSENPFFTKNGQYTYDVTLSLEDAQNARIYKHYNRLNNADPIASKRTATLIVDNRVLLRGTEIILEITEKQVKVQLVSGESELNYFIGGNRKLNELDLDIVHAIDISGTKFHFAPFYSKTHEKVINSAIVNFYGDDINSNYPPNGIVKKNEIAQPYLYFIINQIINAIGYTVNANFIETSLYKSLYIVNGINTIRYNRMLPDWTVSEFFEAIEKMFNVAIVINESAQKISILQKGNFYQNTQKHYIREVLDEFVQTLDEENIDDYAGANIGYDLPDDDYFKWQDIDRTILDKVEYVHKLDERAIMNYISSFPGDNKKLKNKIFISDESGNEYVHVNFTEEIRYFIKRVNMFKPILSNPQKTDLDIEFKITPVAMKVVDVETWHYWDDRSGESGGVVHQKMKGYPMSTQMPVIESDDFEFNNELDNSFVDIQEEIEGNIKKSKTDNIQLAFYTGYHTIHTTEGNPTYYMDYPVPFVDYFWEDMWEYNIQKIDPNNLTLRLDDPNGLKKLYFNANSLAINTTREYTFKFISKEKLDPKAIFVINNKQFACKQLKYNIDENGMDSIIQGVFYPVAG
ncbi:hypothetical protein SAMD00024442_6_61 [Candidatus Symbiothrix dinenymphae]|nr:hypothetical protein SAMD00024442_6_61 [Candidatus Symbiothrix dinenymphae]